MLVQSLNQLYRLGVKVRLIGRSEFNGTWHINIIYLEHNHRNPDRGSPMIWMEERETHNIDIYIYNGLDTIMGLV